MSTTKTKLPLADAIEAAEAFRDLFDGTFQRWEIAGSIRRQRPAVGDVEHVVIPKTSQFGRNLVWDRMEALLPGVGLFGSRGTLEMAVYPDGKHRFGDLLRGVMFGGIRHEIFSADKLNWGAVLTIRTGSADFSRRMVTQMRARGEFCQGGVNGEHRGYVCRINSNSIVECPDERTFFEMCGESWREPREREA
jgi:DNA polymerase/3'-5' exonuclease PolX